MGRIILAAILGGIVLMVWGFLSWVLLFHTLMPTPAMTDDAAVAEVLRANTPEHGVYWFPPLPEIAPDATDAESQAMMDAYKESHRAGPVGYAVIMPDGGEPQPPPVLAIGLGINILAAFLAALLLGGACVHRNYGQRVIFVVGLGVFITVAVHLVSWNFMYHPVGFTLFRSVDTVVAWLLAGFVIAACVKRVPAPA